MPLEPADIADVIGEHLGKLRREMRFELDRQALEGRAALAELRADAAILAGQLRERADADTARVAASLATVRDGMPGADGRDGEPGAPGADGRDGLDGAAGKDGPPGADAAPGSDGAAGQDGAPGLAGKDGADGIDGRDGLDGAGIAEAFIGRDGELVLTYTDGRIKNLGAGFARDLNADAIRGMVSAAAADLWKGVWEAREYQRGDWATYGGSLFVAVADVTAKDQPAASEGWRLALKRGRDGKDAEPPRPSRPPVVLDPPK